MIAGLLIAFVAASWLGLGFLVGLRFAEWYLSEAGDPLEVEPLTVQVASDTLEVQRLRDRVRALESALDHVGVQADAELEALLDEMGPPADHADPELIRYIEEPPAEAKRRRAREAGE